MKSWKKLWKQELDSKIPELDSEVKNYPLPHAAETDTQTGGGTLAKRRSPLLFSMLALLATALIAAAVICAVMLAPKDGFDGFIFTVEINPSVTVTADGDGKVTAVIAGNEDADIVLACGTAEEMCGKPFEQAVTVFTDKAAELGFLNLNQTSAVRVTACENGQPLLQSACASLEKYFMQKGVYAFVMTEVAEFEKFSALCGLTETQNIKELYGSVTRSETLFAKRSAQGASAETLEKIYETYVSAEAFTDGMKNFLSDKLAIIKRNAEDIKNLTSLYLEIYGHKDNPAKLLKDYWNVKKYYANELLGEFALLVADMDAALERYESDYGTAITNELQLKAAADSYIALSVEKLAALLENLTADLLKQNAEYISGLLKLIGIDGGAFTQIFTPPETIEEFGEKIISVISAEYDCRIKQYAEIYGKEREEISPEEYNKFKEQFSEKFSIYCNKNNFSVV